MKHWMRNCWWWIRGVGPDDYRNRCGRCGNTGQAHWSLWECVRFRVMAHICMHCKNVMHPGAKRYASHSCCPECLEKYHPECQTPLK